MRYHVVNPIQYDTTVSQKHNKKLYYICILYTVWKQLHVLAFFLGHHQVVLTSLKNAVHGLEAVSVMMRSHASYNISCKILLGLTVVRLVVLGFGCGVVEGMGRCCILLWSLYITCSVFFRIVLSRRCLPQGWCVGVNLVVC